jgi:potassium-transporting ATPase ATP-binding subunit
MTNNLFSRLSKALAKPTQSSQPTDSTPSSSGPSAGKLITVKSGEMIPCDGEVIEGFATVDESAIVGVSTPAMIDSSAGRNQVLADTHVVEGSLTIRCSKNGGKQRSY